MCLTSIVMSGKSGAQALATALNVSDHLSDAKKMGRTELKDSGQNLGR